MEHAGETSPPVDAGAIVAAVDIALADVESHAPLRRSPAQVARSSRAGRSPSNDTGANGLVVGAVDDPAEAAADRFADRVLRRAVDPPGREPPGGDAARHGSPRAETRIPGPPSPGFGSEATTRVRRSAASPMARTMARTTAPTRIQRSTNPGQPGPGHANLGDTVGPAGGATPPAVDRAIRASAGRGDALEPGLRSRIERAANVDLGGVSIHRNSDAAPRIQARAFTVGNDIHFAPGEYDPHSASGERLIAHEVGHVVQQPSGSKARRTVRRAPLSAKAVVDAVDGLDPTMTAHLDSLMTGEDAMSTGTKETVRTHVTAAVTAYLANTIGNDVKDNAVMLSIAIDGVAGVVADALYDPWLRSKIAGRLLDLYKTQLTHELTPGPKPALAGADADARHTTALAGVLLTNDPVGLHMHNELSKDEAARRITLMAKDAQGALNDFDPAGTKTLSADEMFTMLRRRFESQMLVYTKSAVKRREDLGRDNNTKRTEADTARNTDESVDSTKATAYSTRESTGHMSVRYFNELFGANATPQRIADFTAKASGQLDALGVAVHASTAAWGPAGPPIAVRDPSVTQNQERVLQSIEAFDATINRANVITALEQYAQTALGFSIPKATAAVAQIVAKLDTFPITITMPGSSMFEAKVPKGPDTEFKAATVQQRAAFASDSLGKGGDEIFQHVGAYDNPLFQDDRGDTYLQFRIWKDRMMAGNSGLSPEEMPKYGALNVNWESNYGAQWSYAPGKNARAASTGLTDTEVRAKKFPKMSLAEKKQRVSSHAAGENYYGDLHMVMKDVFRQQRRVVFTCTDHGRPHGDPLYAVHDALGGDFITNQKSGVQTKVLNTLFNEVATAPVNKLTSMLMLEAQIYGTVDVATDVAQIVVAPYVHKDVKKHAKAFCKKHKIAYLEIAPDDPKIAQALAADVDANDLTGLTY